MTKAIAIAHAVKAFLFPLKSNSHIPRFLQSRAVFYLIVLLLFARIAAVIMSVNVPASIFLANVTGNDLVNLLNQSRQREGLNPLTENEALNRAAFMKARDMVENNYFSHQNPRGLTPWFWFGKAGYQYAYAGENLAVGFIDSRTVFDAWLDSPSHKGNIVNPHYTEVGTAVIRGFGENNAIVVVQLFGAPRNVAQGGAPESAPRQRISASQTVPIEAPAKEVAGAGLQAPESPAAPQQPFQKGEAAFVNISTSQYVQVFAYGMLMLTLLAAVSHVMAHRAMSQRKMIFRSFIFVVLLSACLAINREFITFLMKF